MKVLVDENIPSLTVRALIDAGHDVLDLRGSEHQGVGDDVLWAMSQREERLLVTTDMGFLQYRAEDHHGILIVRLKQPNRRKIHERILQALSKFGNQSWRGLVVIMQDRAQRVWRAK